MRKSLFSGMATSVLKRALVQCMYMRPVARCNDYLLNQGVRCLSTSTISLSKLYFTEKHEYISVEKKGGDHFGKVGISDYAQDKLGEVVYVQLPEVGTKLEKDDEGGVLESVKAASEVYCPVSGEVTEINSRLSDGPKLINESWLEKGWLFKLKMSSPDELKSLMDEDGYKKYLEEDE